MRTLIFLAASAVIVGLAGSSIGLAVHPATYPWILVGWGGFCVAYAAMVAWRVAR